MKFKIEIELNEEEIMQKLRKVIFNFLNSSIIPKRATIKTFEEEKPILSNVEIKRK